jgi:hypothetical protein
MNNSQITTTKQRLDLLTEIDQTPEEHISDLLKIVRLFRQSILIKPTSLNAWAHAINQINNSEQEQQKKEKIKQLFQSWSELDDENDQKETLKIIESLQGVSI